MPHLLGDSKIGRFDMVDHLKHPRKRHRLVDLRSSPAQSFAKCLCRQRYIWSLNLGQAQNLAILQLHCERPVPTRRQQPRLGLRARHSHQVVLGGRCSAVDLCHLSLAAARGFQPGSQTSSTDALSSGSPSALTTISNLTGLARYSGSTSSIS